MNADQLCGLLAEPSRLRVYAAVVLGAATPEQVAAGTGLDAAVVTKALQRLMKGDLVSATAADGLRADEQAFKDAVRSGRPEREPLSADPERDAVLRSFIRDGRLTHFPTVPAKYRTVLEYLAESFEPDVGYPEAEVNRMLNSWHDDHAALRRGLVDHGLLTRDEGVYRRAS
ncbi:conserved hypothetical protein [Kribbella flavida DSM 17836]|uniref:DUF2087 domain-containing protein n=1 Tax=Kribbella flavida (strain DSM 17836 / JCM 10339 / NBRC 14399) TaxID=479435 RepID=D2PLU6_KRIFD|nr:DUF2087 domain-containing protein [Kribbella flavida]ADB32526.1 conserved hypothetical protein [Kribbella flavida DSM 17836]